MEYLSLGSGITHDKCLILISSCTMPGTCNYFQCIGSKVRVRTVGGDLENFPLKMGLHRGSTLMSISICLSDRCF